MENNERINGTVRGSGASEKIVRLSPISSSADFLLPDYMGDVKRILNYSAKIVPSGKFVGEDSVSFSGTVCYSALYLDSENRLTEASFSSDYECEAKSSEPTEDAAIFCELSQLSLRAQGPRKISAKATLNPEITLAVRRAPSCPESCEGLEILEKTLYEKTVEILSLGTREYSNDAARLEGVGADGVEVLFCGGEFVAGDAECKDGRVYIKGEIDLYALLLIDGETTLRIEKNIPVEENAECECDCADVSVEGILASVRATVSDLEEHGEGEQRCALVRLDASAEYNARLSYNRERSVVCDAFSTSRSCECQYDSYTYGEYITTATDEKIIEIEVEKSETEAQDIADILSTHATVKLIESKLNEGNLYYEAEICATVLVQTSAPGQFASCKCSKRISDKIKIGRECGGAACKTRALLTNASASHDAKTLTVKCTLRIESDMTREKTAKTVSAVTLGETFPDESRCPEITVLYPEKDDTLWSIARKYSISVVKLAEENMLDGECIASCADTSVASVPCLIIEKGLG